MKRCVSEKIEGRNKKNVPLLVDTHTEQKENSTGDGFEAGAYW